MKRALLLVSTVFMAAGILFANGGEEKQFPQRNIEAIVQYSAGGVTDLASRGLFDVASADLPKGISIVTSNVTGGAGLVGLNKFISSKPDGYTLGITNIDLVINYALGKTPISMDDYIPLACAFYTPNVVIIAPSPNYSTFNEFIEYAKAHPNELIASHSGIGSNPHLSITALAKHFGIQFRYIANEGDAATVASMAGGHVHVAVAAPGPSLSQIQAGGIKALAIYSSERSPDLPNVPTIKELYPDFSYDSVAWGVVSVPKGTPPDVVSYLSSVLEKARASDKYADTLRNLHMDRVTMSIDRIQPFLKSQYQDIGELCKGLQ
jgi:tripartite-type tricarboxylate transporter receptor subunit TctC